MNYLVAFAMLASLAFPAEKPRVLILTDMEGVAGVQDADEQLEPGQRRYEESRKLLIGETNAAVQGALAGGAREVVRSADAPVRSLIVGIVDEVHTD